MTKTRPQQIVVVRSRVEENFRVDSGTQLAWRSAVVPVPARGRVRLSDVPADPRQRAIDAMADWCREGEGPLWLIEGPSGTGKTELASEVAYRLDRRAVAVRLGPAGPGRVRRDRRRPQRPPRARPRSTTRRPGPTCSNCSARWPMAARR
jgi:hypothetical protein